MTKEERTGKLLLRTDKNISESMKKKLKFEEDYLKSFLSQLKSQENSIIKSLTRLDKDLTIFKKNQNNFSSFLNKEETFLKKFLKFQEDQTETQIKNMTEQEKISKKYQNFLKQLEEDQKRKKEEEEKYFSSLRKVELQKIAARQRLTREKTMRLERLNSIRQAELEKKAEEEDLNESLVQDSPLEVNETEDVLAAESKIIESLVLICGSFFCSQCYRMLKRSSLFLKCDKCCASAFNKQLPPSSSGNQRPKIPPGSVCVGCEAIIKRGEIVQCICCYIRQEFLKDFSPITCGGCNHNESVSWVDTYVGSRYEMINCGFCQRSVNYLYVVEICTSCHDQVCLHCLRKNNFLAISVCNECHSRRQVNPYKRLQRKPTF
jgi:hypothetical protein